MENNNTFTITFTITNEQLAKVKADVEKAVMKKDSKKFISAVLDNMTKVDPKAKVKTPNKAPKKKGSAKKKAAWKLDASKVNEVQLDWLSIKCQEIWKAEVTKDKAPIPKNIYWKAQSMHKALEAGNGSPKQIVGLWNILMGSAENMNPKVVELRNKVAAKLAA